MSWEEAAHNWVQTFVNQCKTGTHAELRLFCEGEHLKVTVCADLGRLTAKTANWSDCWGVPKCGPSRVRRRERRAAERAAVGAAENVAAKTVAAEKADAKKASTVEVVAEKVASEEVVAKKGEEKAVAEEVVVEHDAAEAEKASAAKDAAEKVSADEDAAEKEVVVKVAAEKEAAKKEAAEASTSCCGSGKQTAPPSTTPEEGAVNQVEETPPPLPLCLYCCHRGSGKNPVHYYLQCVCGDRACTCWCYCTEAQIEHKKLVYPGGFGCPGYPVKTVKPMDRPKAKALAEARTFKLSNRACENPSCLSALEKDNARALGRL